MPAAPGGLRATRRKSSLFIDNADRTASAPYNEYDTIEVSRRIEREAGSVYRINGRDVRQRDVQIFFADASSGAASTAFVRQGQIGLLISQKPLARRAILEEAAGIGGLHQRRHEAELRLRAAETNMSRLDDVIREVEGQLQSLKRQARQAARYRNLSGHHPQGRSTRAIICAGPCRLSQTRAAEAALESAAAAVAECTERCRSGCDGAAQRERRSAALRQIEAEKGAALHRLIVERDALDAEEARAREAAQRLRQRIGQAGQDIVREQALDADAQTALAKLAEANRKGLEAMSARAAEDLAAAESVSAELTDALAEAERLLERLTSELAEWHARKHSLDRSREVAAALAETSMLQLDAAQSRLDQAIARAAEMPDVRAAEAAAEEARTLAATAREALTEARAKLEDAESRQADVREPLEVAERACAGAFGRSQGARRSAASRRAKICFRRSSTPLWCNRVTKRRSPPPWATICRRRLTKRRPHHWRESGRRLNWPRLCPAAQHR